MPHPACPTLRDPARGLSIPLCHLRPKVSLSTDFFPGGTGFFTGGTGFFLSRDIPDFFLVQEQDFFLVLELTYCIDATLP